MTNPSPSVKNVSLADLEKGLAQALQQMTGWPVVQVGLEKLSFDTPPMLSSGEAITLSLRVRMRNEEDESFPF